MAVANTIDAVVHDLVREGFNHAFGTPGVELKSDPHWAKISALGTQLWLDTGDVDEAKKLFTKEFSALTTNNTLLNKEVQKGLYDELVGKTAKAIKEAAPDISEQELVLELAFVLNAKHALMLVETFDANVSVELHTDLAHDVERSVAYGKRYYAICPERFIIKVPLTPSGFLAARTLREADIPVNFTLGFSARQNYLAALLTQPTYCNVFMGRNGAFVADSGLGTGNGVGEKATLSTQQELLGLRKAGQSKTKLIGASMRNGEQVGTLAGLDVFTMPTKVAEEYRAHPLDNPESRIHDEVEVDIQPGVDARAHGLHTLWEVSDAFRTATQALAAADWRTLTPEAIEAHYAAAGIADFLPAWTQKDIATFTADGKIPKLEHWKDRLAAGEVGLDALMNQSALYSFVTDQKALDERVRSFI